MYTLSDDCTRQDFLTILAWSLQSDTCVCQASNLDRIRELTREFLPDTLSKIIESIETKTRNERSREFSVELEQDRHDEDRGGQNSREEQTNQDRDRPFSDVERNNEEYRQLEERLGNGNAANPARGGNSAYLNQPTVYYHPMMAKQQPVDNRQERNDPIERPINQGPKDDSYEKNDFIRDQISKLSADMFKLDEPFFEEEQQPRIKRVETQWRGNDDNYDRDVKYDIDEIVEKVRDRLKEDFERHGYGYLLSDAKRPDTRQGANTQNRNSNVPRQEESPKREQGEVYNYPQRNIKKQSHYQQVDKPAGARPYPYNNQEKREVISQEHVRNERPDSRFQVLKKPRPEYEVDDTVREIERDPRTTKGSAPVYTKDFDIPEELKRQDSQMYNKKPLGKKGKDSYEDYQIPPKEANIYASEEARKPNRDQHHMNKNYNNQQQDEGRQFTPKRLVKRISITTEPIVDYQAMTMADTQFGMHAVTEVMKWEYDEGTLKEKEQSRAHTVLPTKKRFKSVSPNYYISQPTVVEKYNFEEPIPEKEQVPESQGPKIGIADTPDITINNRGNKLKRLLRTA